MRIDAGSDFADLFEVKDALEKKGAYYQRAERGRLVLGYKREPFVARDAGSPRRRRRRSTTQGLTFKVKIEPHGEWATDLDVLAA